MAYPDGAASVNSVATRVAALDQYGNIPVGSPTYCTDQLVKATFAPVVETGDDLVQKNADGNIIWHYKHGNMPKYWTVSLDMATPDPTLENILAGGTLLYDSTAALTAPTSAPTATAAGTGGVLPVGSYLYKYSYANQYGETAASPELAAAVAVTAGQKVTLTMTAGTGNAYVNVYRTVAGGATGTEQLVATIAAGTSFVDDGTNGYADGVYRAPSGALPTANTTAGPSLAAGAAVGIQAAPLGTVGQPNGFCLELWGRAIVKGVQATYLPYYRYIIPMVKNAMPETRAVTDAGLENIYTGEAFENPNAGGGPFGDFQFDTSKVWDRIRASAFTVPKVGFTNTPATS